MVFRGTVMNGRVVLSEPLEVPNGTPVDIRPGRLPAKKLRTKPRAKKAKRRVAPKTFLESIAPFIGSIKGLPRDASLNIDHYLYGAKKR